MNLKPRMVDTTDPDSAWYIYDGVLDLGTITASEALQVSDLFLDSIWDARRERERLGTKYPKSWVRTSTPFGCGMSEHEQDNQPETGEV